MKHYINFLTITQLLTIATCIAMEKETIKKPRSIAFIDNNRVVVGGENGCAVFNSHSKKLIQKLTSHQAENLAANKDIIAVISYYKSKQLIKHKRDLTIFDATTYTQKWSTKKWAPEKSSSHMALNSVNNTIFLIKNNDINIYDCNEQKAEKNKKKFLKVSNICSYANHPLHNGFIITDFSGLVIYHPLKYEYSANAKCMILQPLQYIHIADNSSFSTTRAILSPDGNNILFKRGNMNKNCSPYFIYNITQSNKTAHYVLDDELYIAFAFHPTISLLAALSADNKVKFWDYATHTLIATMHQLPNECIPYSKNTWDTYYSTKILSFSPDGSQIAIAMPDSWHITQTPCTNHNSSALILETLKTNNIPKDIIQLIIPHITTLINVAPLIIPPIVQPNPSQKTQYYSIKHWITFADPTKNVMQQRLIPDSAHFDFFENGIIEEHWPSS